MTPVDEACRVLAEMAREMGANDITVKVYDDDSVWLEAHPDTTKTRQIAHASLDPDDGPLPSEALAKWRGER